MAFVETGAAALRNSSKMIIWDFHMFVAKPGANLSELKKAIEVVLEKHPDAVLVSGAETVFSVGVLS